jgi:hypothetical protein
MMFPDLFQRTRRPLTLVQPQASSADLPGTGVTLPFNMETQEQSEWCWSAVAVSVSRFYQPSSTITQCGLANLELNTDVCCADPSICNQQNTLETSLSQVGHFNDMVFAPLTFDETDTEIDSQRPVGCRIGWFLGGGHFVIIHGIATQSSGGLIKQWVAVADPKFGPADYLIDNFTNAYRQGEGEWTHSYLTQ